ncbi:unnamed protein product [Hydatigera taeniaeformis]|uniref:Amino acid adenylation n=1 Tax=Hydatigena taeniaeformis TaxID=6205 RepID=A0A0R3WWA7_HYDTA|nr:unnamed protein product [Hydatigera taeniaeformis]
MANLRFQYWEDFVQALTGSQNLTSGMVQRSPIEAELDWARNRPVDVAFRDCSELEGYAEATNAPIHYALAEAFGVSSLTFMLVVFSLTKHAVCVTIILLNSDVVAL